MSAKVSFHFAVALVQPFTEHKLSGRQLMCQKQAVKFSHVIHIRSQGGCEEEEVDEGVMEGGGEEGVGTSQRLA